MRGNGTMEHKTLRNDSSLWGKESIRSVMAPERPSLTHVTRKINRFDPPRIEFNNSRNVCKYDLIRHSSSNEFVCLKSHKNNTPHVINESQSIRSNRVDLIEKSSNIQNAIEYDSPKVGSCRSIKSALKKKGFENSNKIHRSEKKIVSIADINDVYLVESYKDIYNGRVKNKIPEKGHKSLCPIF